MSFTEFMKKNIMSYFIIVTGITIVMAVFGGSVDPDRSFGYNAFYSPLLYAAVAVFPSIVFYSKKELTFRQMLFRKILHFLLIELLLIGFSLYLRVVDDLITVLALAAFILLVYLFTSIIQWFIDTKTMVEINKGLKRLQDK